MPLELLFDLAGAVKVLGTGVCIRQTHVRNKGGGRFPAETDRMAHTDRAGAYVRRAQLLELGNLQLFEALEVTQVTRHVVPVVSELFEVYSQILLWRCTFRRRIQLGDAVDLHDVHNVVP